MQRGRAHIRNANIGVLDQLQQRGSSRRGFEVERDRSLVLVKVQKFRCKFAGSRWAPQRAQQIAAGRFDLDDVGPVFGEELCRDRPNDN